MQFRLKSLFWLVFVAAVGCGVLFALPDWASCIVLAAVALMSPAAVVAGIVYGRGARRAFAIGCLASGGWAMFGMPYLLVTAFSNGFDGITEIDSDTALVIKIAFVAYYGFLSLSGLASVGIRRFCYQGRNRIRPPRECC
ncbi:MAG TPA: hypothetical protein VFI31_10220 [Pirellulales bacterium]|nr:hypothetical protein [Pirellulales bacterium]